MNSRTQNSSPSRAKPNLEIASSTPLEAIFVAKAGLNLPADQESDATRYAEGLVVECENWEGNVIFEIRGFHTASGNPATISFNHSTDFDYSEMDV